MSSMFGLHLGLDFAYALLVSNVSVFSFHIQTPFKAPHKYFKTGSVRCRPLSFRSKISARSEIRNENCENELILDGFNGQKLKRKMSKVWGGRLCHFLDHIT
jgi:hypothetical protein